ncbi:hypothetical protein EGW08_004615 [Elysia chlorotica]|uniref:RING-type domain-containing protein n=1 Tax=Elysia chlorotica TaxID=188477 RepID=A0A3S1ABL3_ELYCH|nr:hypothetical protein EGW08_004615 [Elysia chlorotica]
MSRFDVKSFCTAPDPELVCGICMNVLDEPKETPCRHVFCNACITRALETKKGCPMCRTRVTIPDLRPVLPLVNNLLNKLPMTCKNYRGEKISASCKTIIKKEFYLDHLKKCEFEYVDCPHQGCKDMVIRREQTEHQESCLYRTVECPKCDTQYTYKDRRSHCCVTAMKKRMQG